MSVALPGKASGATKILQKLPAKQFLSSLHWTDWALSPSISTYCCLSKWICPSMWEWDLREDLLDLRAACRQVHVFPSLVYHPFAAQLSPHLLLSIRPSPLVTEAFFSYAAFLLQIRQPHKRAYRLCCSKKPISSYARIDTNSKRSLWIFSVSFHNMI